VLRVSDIRAAVDFYTTKLGFWEFVHGPATKSQTSPGSTWGDVQIFLEKGTRNHAAVRSTSS
jgi:hypothetical protein